MNAKNTRKHLQAKMRDWLSYIDDEEVKEVIKKETIITGGALVSLLSGEKVNDYDVYFKTQEGCIKVAKYYADKWNSTHEKPHVKVIYGDEMKEIYHLEEDTGAVRCFVRSEGLAAEDSDKKELEDAELLNYAEEEDVEVRTLHGEDVGNTDDEKPKYRPKFITSNAITLSDKIQIVTRFWGDVETIHENFDYVHCTCAYDYYENKLYTPEDALLAIMNKELVYRGSKYPICSIIRSRKYINRGYTINAGQYVKMCLQLSNFDLTNVWVLEDQLTGVDSLYFHMLIDALKEHMTKHNLETVDSNYVIELVNRMF